MSPAELEAYLHAHIPLSAAMAVSVARADSDIVVLEAPLAPNINHRETAFGGSLAAVATLSAWSLLRLRLGAADCAGRIVIHDNTMHYEHAVTGAFTATARIDPATDWDRCLRVLHRRGRVRIPVAATIAADGVRAGHFLGRFVVLAMEG